MYCESKYMARKLATFEQLPTSVAPKCLIYTSTHTTGPSQLSCTHFGFASAPPSTLQHPVPMPAVTHTNHTRYETPFEPAIWKSRLPEWVPGPKQRSSRPQSQTIRGGEGSRTPKLNPAHSGALSAKLLG